MEQLINRFYKELVNILPFKDAHFRAELKTAGLFAGDLKETTESKPSSAEMTSYFLDHGINNNEETFLNLIKVMEKFNSKPVNDLASKIRKNFEHLKNEPGTLVLCIQWNLSKAVTFGPGLNGGGSA